MYRKLATHRFFSRYENHELDLLADAYVKTPELVAAIVIESHKVPEVTAADIVRAMEGEVS